MRRLSYRYGRNDRVSLPQILAWAQRRVNFSDPPHTAKKAVVSVFA